MFAAAKELECGSTWRAGVAAVEPERAVLFDVVRLGHGDPDTEKHNARDRPSSASPTMHLHLHAVETSGRAPRTGPVAGVRVARLHGRRRACLSLRLFVRRVTDESS